MELKKNPNADLNKRSTIYMQIGLIAVLLLAWATIESKSFAKNVTISQMASVDLLDDEWSEEIKTEEPKVELPKPKVVVVDKIEVVDNDKDVPETIIDAIDTDEDEPVVDIADIDVEDEDLDLPPVPFNLIEDAPIFPGCETVPKGQRKKCFTEKIHKHIKKNFEYPEIAKDMGVQGRVYCMFTISETGKITDFKFRGPDKNLEKEASRIMHKLPKMKAGKQRGRAVRVPFSIPITFRLAD